MKFFTSIILSLTLSASRLLAADALPQVDHVIIVEFENTDYKKAMAQPTFATLAKQGANLSNFYAETHPSQPNYLAMIGGETFGVKGDGNVNIDDRHIGDLIEEAGKTWKVYADDYPGNCFLGAKSGEYARKHVPFLSFKNVQTNPQRCANIVEGKGLKADLSSGNLPNFALYIPNLSNDGHDTGVAYADNWLKIKFLPLLDSTLPPNTLVVFTFDESTFFGGNHIYTSFYGDMVEPGSIFSSKTNHYGFLHTVEALLGLGDLGKMDSTSPVIDGIWHRN
ncbi:MAG: hypothetical protein EOP04_06410 [Proteobacteria bacterium]|nr:MAG: hypothetical protein EOP04_06410 [Pseudomonadota bacterium]